MSFPWEKLVHNWTMSVFSMLPKFKKKSKESFQGNYKDRVFIVVVHCLLIRSPHSRTQGSSCSLQRVLRFQQNKSLPGLLYNINYWEQGSDRHCIINRENSILWRTSLLVSGCLAESWSLVTKGQYHLAFPVIQPKPSPDTAEHTHTPHLPRSEIFLYLKTRY